MKKRLSVVLLNLLIIMLFCARICTKMEENQLHIDFTFAG